MRVLQVIIIAVLTCFSVQAQQKYKLANSTVHFFSEAPMENIEASSTKTTAIIDADKKTFAFKIPIRSFHFEKELMEEHFNENYMESEKYPNAVFTGNIVGAFSLAKDGVYSISAEGVLDVHGVKQPRKINAVITVLNGKATLKSDFTIKLEDHTIKIPSVMMYKVAEIIAVDLNGEFTKVVAAK